MPIREFTCRGCGERFERLLGSSDPAPACPSCGSPRVARRISVIAGLASNGGDRPVSAGCACGGACACGA